MKFHMKEHQTEIIIPSIVASAKKNINKFYHTNHQVTIQCARVSRAIYSFCLFPKNWFGSFDYCVTTYLNMQFYGTTVTIEYSR